VGLSELAVDGVAPSRAERPSTAEQVAAAIANANARGAAVVVQAGRTRIGVGDPPERYDVALDLGALRGVVEHSPADLVCTVRAGTTLAELEEALRASGQRWPVEVAHPELATVGGTVAGAAAGPSRLRYQHPRDWIIGCRAVLGDGTLTRAGGRVVKNVTGFDLTRLYAGTYGTLVVLVELTLKLIALPQRTMTLRIDRTSLAAALDVAASLRETHLPLDALAIRGDGRAARVHVRLAGTAAAVERLAAAVRTHGAAEDDDATWQALTSATAEGDDVARAVWPAGHRPPDTDLGNAVLYPGSGIAFLLDPIPPERFRAMRAAFESGGGALIVERANAEYKRAVGGAWGTIRTPARIARALKERFDPNAVLAPGRIPLASIA